MADASGSGERNKTTILGENTKVSLKAVCAVAIVVVIPLAVYLTKIQDDVGVIRDTLKDAVTAMKTIEGDHETRIRDLEKSRKP